MDIKTLTTGLVTLVVAVIIIALVAVPIVEDQASGKWTGSNSDAASRYTDFTGQAVEWTWHAGSGTVNGATSPNAAPAILTDTIIVRTTSSQYYIYDLVGGGITSHTGSSYTVTFTCSAEGAWSISVNDSEYATGTATKLWISTSNGNWGLFKDNPTRATIGGSVYIASFQDISVNGPMRCAEFINGQKVGDLFTPWVIDSSTVTVATSPTYVVDYEEVGEGQKVGSYQGVETSFSDTTITSYNIFAPIQYESTEGSEGTNYVLLSIIPLLLFIVAIMVAVRLIRM